MTCSVGFRAPAATALAAELLQRIADAAGDEIEDERDKDGPAPTLYRDPTQPATSEPAAIPLALQSFAQQAVQALLAQPVQLQRALGEILSEPKPRVWFQAGTGRKPGHGLRLAPATRMLYDEQHVYINGESYRASGSDAALLHRLANQRHLVAADCDRFSTSAFMLLDAWQRHGWLLHNAT